MRKITGLCIACGMAASLVVSAGNAVAQTKIKSSLDAPNQLYPQNPRHKPYVEFQKTGGVSGGCYKITGDVDGKVPRPRVVSPLNAMLKIVNVSDPLSFKIKVKGKGKFRLTFTAYDSGKKYFTQFDKVFKIDTHAAWLPVEHIYKPTVKNKAYLEKGAYFMGFFILDEGEFLVNDLEFGTVQPEAGIVLDK